MSARHIAAAAALATLSGPCMAHGFGGSGWIHPLTGVDHMLAMVAVGLWSAQLGGRALAGIPVAFVVAMAIGSAVGLHRYPVEGIEALIAFSVLALGTAIAIRQQLAWPVAATASLAFGLSHGYVHSLEMPDTASLEYAAGFLLTTAGLHVAGAAAGLLLLEEAHGQRWLRIGGAVIAAVGGVLLHGAL